MNGHESNPEDIVTQNGRIRETAQLDVVADDRERVSDVIEQLQAQESIMWR